MIKIRAGDWVEISSTRPYFDGQVAEVVEVYDANNNFPMVELAISRTPGHATTRWSMAHLTKVPHIRAVEVLGEDYFD